ncbi:MAG: hypothetical protein B7Z06_05290 [Flavobacteriales bacterium 32-35-8]|nr:MAG: hypothetical protein B7Z06_05290 [Flavobacteriales bacterium 32-35-8]
MLKFKTNYFTSYCLLLLYILLNISSCSSSGIDNSVEQEIEEGGNQEETITNAQTIGLNFNEQLQFVDIPQISATNTDWVRGFVEFFQLYENRELLNTDERITKFLTLKPSGFKTVLSLKFQFRGIDYPAPNSQELNDYLDYMDVVLDRIWNGTDIIIVGNEPFIETDEVDFGDNMYNFYVKASERVKAYSDAHTEKPIFFGAFDNMYQDRRRNLPVLNGLLEYSKNTAWISGVDMHIHHNNYNEMISAIDFVNTRIREDQKIIISEYSLMKHWRDNLNGFIPATFASQYSYPSTWRNYQYIDSALKAPKTRAEWVDFLSKSDWFESRKHYLLETYQDIFTTYDKFFLATYAFRQAYPFNTDFTSNTDPWVLNGIYVNRSVEPNPNTGQFQFNYSFIDDFRIVQDISKTN